MMYGLLDSKRVTALPELRSSIALCPLCKTPLVAKCGDIKIWHWAHKAFFTDCDTWHQGETEWHIQWKSLFPEDTREVVIGDHRADVKLGQTILEFQHSYLSHKEFTERENYYHSLGLNVVWIFDARAFSTTWWAEESTDRQRFYVGLSTIKPMWTFPRFHLSILHFGQDDLAWIHTADQSMGYGVFIQRPILVERFNAQNFIPPLNNLYRMALRESPPALAVGVRQRCPQE